MAALKVDARRQDHAHFGAGFAAHHDGSAEREPAQIEVVSAAMSKAAQSEGFQKYLRDQLAFADSFIPAGKTGAFLAEQLALIEAGLPKKT